MQANNESNVPELLKYVKLAWTPELYHIPEEVTFHNGVCYKNIQVNVNKPVPYPYGSVIYGIFGSAFQGGDKGPEGKEKKYWEDLSTELGEKISLFRNKNPEKKEIVILNGAPPGLPQCVANGSSKYGGFVAGISAAENDKTHSKIVGYDLSLNQTITHNLIVYPNLTYDLPLVESNADISKDDLIDRLKWRNPLNTEFSDICIALDGNYGTLYEISMALHPNYSIVGVLTPNAKKPFEEIEGKMYLGDFIKLFHDLKGSVKNKQTKVIASDDPGELVEDLYDAWNIRREKLKKNPNDPKDNGIYHPSVHKPFETKIIKPLEIRMARRFSKYST